tara:strand:+ start:17065 stop:17826 length:762 start_codon:yes stop_codon:yes gene_type:complete
MKILLILLFALSFRCDAASLEGELTPLINGSVSLEEGAIFEGVLRIWPVSNEWNNENLLKLDKTKLGENFHIIKVISSELSMHNQEVAELKAVMAVVKALKPKDKISIEISKQQIPIEIRRITTIATAPPAQEFSFVEQPEYELQSTQRMMTYVGGASSSLLIIGLLVFIIYRLRKKKEQVKLKNRLKERIKEAGSRDLIEALAKDLSQIEVHLQIKNKDDFLSQLNEIQFKQNWSEVELQNIIEKKEKLIHD